MATDAGKTHYLGDDCPGGHRNELVEDGFGSTWVKHGPDCDLHVVRPGKAQCNCDGH